MKAPQVGVDIYLRGDSLSFNLSPKDFMKLNCYSSCTQRSLRLPLSNELLKYILTKSKEFYVLLQQRRKPCYGKCRLLKFHTWLVRDFTAYLS